MKIKYLLFAICVSMIASAAQAVDSTALNIAGSMGLGLEVGQPIGVTGKAWLSSVAAVDGAAGYHYNHNFDAHVDYLLHSYALGDICGHSAPLYVGLGGRILAGDDTQFGLRIPFGIAYLLQPHRIELFAEIAPVIDLSNLGADVDGVMGIRFYSF